jgi:hypothetical protein
VITVGDQTVPLIEYIENGIRSNLTQGHCVLITENEYNEVLSRVEAAVT